MVANILESQVPLLLEHLDENTSPRWGKMEPQHMVEHLFQTMLVSFGKIEVKVFSPEEKLPVLKQILLSEQPLPRNFKAPVHKEGQLPPLLFKNLEDAKAALIQSIEEFEMYYQQHPESKHNHPVFGPLNGEEWSVFHQKHFTHHFIQFGMIEDKE
jgi:hypothetical protein